MKRTKEEARLTREQIIEKAVQLFIQKGFSDTTLDEIAQKVGVSRGAIYWHFKDKLDIVKELITTEHNILTNLLTNKFCEKTTPFLRIQNVIDEIIKHFFSSNSFRNFIELTWFKIEYTQLMNLQSSKAELTEYFITNIKSVIEESQELGEIKSDIIPDEAAITISNMINGMYRLYFILPSQLNSEPKAISIFTNYLNLLKK